MTSLHPDEFTNVIRRVQDPQTAINLICGYGSYAAGEALKEETAFRFGAVAFLVDQSKGMIPTILRAHKRDPQTPKYQGRNTCIDAVLYPGIASIVFGDEALYSPDAALARCDAFSYFQNSMRDEVGRFVEKTFRTTLGKQQKDRPFSKAITNGLLFMSRLCFDEKEPVAMGIEIFFLLNAWMRLDFESIIEYAHDRGDDPFPSLEGRAREDEALRNRCAGDYLITHVVANLDGSSGMLNEALLTILRSQAPFLGQRPDMFNAVVEMARHARLQTTIDTFNMDPYAIALVKEQLSRPGAKQRFTALMQLEKNVPHLWQSIPSEQLEEALTDLIAQGDFRGAGYFFQATRNSNFFPALKADFRARELNLVRDYLRTRMPKIVERAYELGRLDVAAVLIERYWRELGLSVQDAVTARTLSLEACSPTAVIHGDFKSGIDNLDLYFPQPAD